MHVYRIMDSIVEINLGNFGSTGTIMCSLSDMAEQNSIKAWKAYPLSRNKKKNVEQNDYVLCSNIEERIFQKVAYYFGLSDRLAFFKTKRFCKFLKKENVKVLHLHNLHGSYINLPVLFNYIKKNNVKVIWTLHDCWAFTGHCPHFTVERCEKWKTGCYNCPKYKEYPHSFFDDSKKMYKLKKKWFTGVKDLTIVTPSNWLAGLVKQSFLKDYPVKVIHNGIDLSVFKPTNGDFKQKYGIPEEKFVLLGVAFGWGMRKGLDVFIELQKRLEKEKYQIVLVGTDDETDKQLPPEIISVHRTQNQTELARIYTAADLFVNPTREEVLGLVNIEANACGTPVITFKTGGSPECISEKSGAMVDCDNIDLLEKEIRRICETMPFKKEDCIEQAKRFDMNQRFEEYIELYKDKCRQTK